MHENKYLSVERKHFLTQDGKRLKHPMLIFDKELGVIYAIGEKGKDFEKLFNLRKEKLKDIDEDMSKALTLVDMSKYKLSVDNTCTIINYLIENSGEDAIMKLYEDTKDELLEVCEKLRKYGY